MAETTAKLGVAARTPALCLPSAYARMCARLGLPNVQPWKQKAARLGVAGAGEVGFEHARARARMDRGKTLAESFDLG
jgi:hypothetical protein